METPKYIDTRPINFSERLIGVKDIENGVRLIMWDGSEIAVWIDDTDGVDKARITFTVAGTDGGHGFRLNEDQTIALMNLFTPRRSST